MKTHPFGNNTSLRNWLAVIGGALGAFMAIIDIQVTNASLREIKGSLGLSLTEGSWISTSYLIAEIISIPLTATLSEVFGTKKFLCTNVVIFIVASMFCACSWNLESIVASRVLQGLAGGVLIPMSFQIIMTELPESQRNYGLTVFGLTATLGPTLGPSLGGYLTDHFDWRAVFYINLLPGLLTILLLAISLKPQKTALQKLHDFDWPGAILLSIGLSSLTYLLEEGARREWFADNAIRTAFIVSVGSLLAFFASWPFRKNHVVSLKVFRDRNFAVAGIITLLCSMAIYGGVYATSLYLGQVQNYSPSAIGLTLMWVGVPQLFVMPLLPWLMRKVDSRWLAAVGFFVFTLSSLLNSWLDSNYAGDQFRFSLILRALGQPLFIIPLSALAMSKMQSSEVKNASAIYNTIRNLGGSIGISLVSTFLVKRTEIHLQNHGSVLELDRIELLNDYQPLQINYYVTDAMTWIESQSLTLKHVLSVAYRDSVILSFGDSFFMICIATVLCMSLVPFLNKTAGFIRTQEH